MTNATLFIVCIIVAVIMFILAALKVTSDRIDTMAIGLAFLAGALFFK